MSHLCLYGPGTDYRKAPVSRKTDLYSLGCVLFEMLTGHTPFEAETPAAMLMMHLDEDPPRLRGLNMQCPIWLETLINRLLEKDPGDRPFDAEATRLALEEVRVKEATHDGVSSQAATGGATSVSIDAANLKRFCKKRRNRRSRKRKPNPLRTGLVPGSVPVYGHRCNDLGLWPDSPETMYDKATAYLKQGDSNGLYYGLVMS
ncbi:MAG: hypothetical protein R3C11_28785 [Planctomycetaceae bacterium]